MRTSDFDYCLPRELIAQTPIEPRDHSRLLVLDRRAGIIGRCRFCEIGEYLRPGDVLVMNDSRVIPARLLGRKTGSEGRAEVLLLERQGPDVWRALVRGRGLLPGATIDVESPSRSGPGLRVEIIESGNEGLRMVRLSDERLIPGFGLVPLPPYIREPLADPERYQTVYSKTEGSAAAPTAGLHFTPALLVSLNRKGVRTVFITLHIGLDTFRPVKEDDPRRHVIHREFALVDAGIASEIAAAKDEGRRVIAVGTTAARALEHAARSGRIAPFNGWVDTFILPGFTFRVVDAMVTNFHLPRSTLLMLVSAFAGQELVKAAYREAVAGRYRFYSFGDAMLII